MMDFFEFLNKATTEEMKEQAGITPALAEKLLAARPFAAEADIFLVSGMTEKKLSKMKEIFEKSDQPEAADEHAIAEVETTEESEQEEPVRRRSAGRWIGWIVVILLLAGAAYAVVRWGIPFIYEKYIKPVETNAADITDLASQQSSEITRLDGEISAMQARVSTLEARADSVDQSLKNHEEMLAQLETMDKLLDQQLATQKSDLLEELDTQIDLTRGIELLSRSRLYLSESNFGLAKTDLQSCRDLLYVLMGKLPADQVGAMTLVIDRLDKAIENLPAYPVVAVYDVDTAWQYLVDGLPNMPQVAVTPVVLPPTPTSTPEATELAPTTEGTLDSTTKATATP